jgi:hypothetical protein
MRATAAKTARKQMLSPQAELEKEIREKLPHAQEWLTTSHALLGGDSPEQRLLAGDVESVRNLFESILYIGIS